MDRSEFSELTEESSSEVAAFPQKCILRVTFPCGNGVGQRHARETAVWVMGEAEKSVGPSCKGLFTPDIWLSIQAPVTCNPTSQLLPRRLPLVLLPTSFHCVLAHLLGLTQPRSHVPQTSEWEIEGKRSPFLWSQGQQGAELILRITPTQNISNQQHSLSRYQNKNNILALCVENLNKYNIKQAKRNWVYSQEIEKL